MRFRQEVDQLESKNLKLKSLANIKYNYTTIVRMWCHEWFDLEEAPDIVTFSKKMLTGGLYYKPELKPKQAWRIFNTWVGDPSKVFTICLR